MGKDSISRRIMAVKMDKYAAEIATSRIRVLNMGYLLEWPSFVFYHDPNSGPIVYKES